ncbi:hydroxyacylglutathione hydrolase [Rhodovulum sp. 12E13]|uniref:hydroxyacylglutathione hydrolase n=1 Tax=Rhodovulum sp. 12E13 TaxID=2203891 RepID=UPI000E1597CE|nr:hydroxyacylglutathione hydrolase [Rhodovulum sp. 12E13]RDC73164.1 hydroxyacylglutathione hydrolase [Rhodovulum sp. 12E13]
MTEAPANRAPEIVTIPCRTDNYAFLVLDPEGTGAALVDAPEANPIAAELERRGRRLTDILITHHHGDHVAGVEALRADGVRVIGARRDAHRLPALDEAVEPGDTFTLFGHAVHVMEASGHTMGHVAYHLPNAHAVFTGDSLMAMGCGRLFEGDAETMWHTLCGLAALPPETIVCSGHEYTEANCRFAETVDAGNPALEARIHAVKARRAAGQPTVPSQLAEELAANPFLRAREPDMKEKLGMAGAEDAEVFAEIRRRKDAF